MCFQPPLHDSNPAAILVQQNKDGFEKFEKRYKDRKVSMCDFLLKKCSKDAKKIQYDDNDDEVSVIFLIH